MSVVFLNRILEDLRLIPVDGSVFCLGYNYWWDKTNVAHPFLLYFLNGNRLAMGSVRLLAALTAAWDTASMACSYNHINTETKCYNRLANVQSFQLIECGTESKHFKDPLPSFQSSFYKHSLCVLVQMCRKFTATPEKKYPKPTKQPNKLKACLIVHRFCSVMKVSPLLILSSCRNINIFNPFTISKFP